jgi:hypothetical protein
MAKATPKVQQVEARAVSATQITIGHQYRIGADTLVQVHGFGHIAETDDLCVVIGIESPHGVSNLAFTAENLDMRIDSTTKNLKGVYRIRSSGFDDMASEVEMLLAFYLGMQQLLLAAASVREVDLKYQVTPDLLTRPLGNPVKNGQPLVLSA